MKNALMKRILLLAVLLLPLAGCNTVFEYIFLPPGRTELTIVPDADAIAALADSGYSISPSGDAIVYDARTWKFEIKYVTDYQLNTFEFPQESDDFEFSSNPYTFGNWVDPELGYTPRRFSVFQVTIFNYSGAKLNYNPELSSLLSDRGDNFLAYAREKKNATNLSIEEYYQKLKGTSGSDDEIFETRMGIARRTMLYFGKPVYKGDSRDGLVVFDPLVDDVERIKIDVKKFITAYDENNEPSEFKDMVFYFKQVPFEKPSDTGQSDSDTTKSNKQSVKISQIIYTSQGGALTYDPPWNPAPRAMNQIVAYIDRNMPTNTRSYNGTFSDQNVKESKIAFLLANGQKPEFMSSFVSGCAEYLSSGGFLFIDNAHFKNEYPFAQYYETFLKDVQSAIGASAEIKNIPMTHEIFTVPNKFDVLPQGIDEVTPGFQKATVLRGLFIDKRLAAVLSPKGYTTLWAEQGAGYEFAGYYEFAINLFNYVLK